VFKEETRETGFVECNIGLGEAVDGTEKEGEAMEEYEHAERGRLLLIALTMGIGLVTRDRWLSTMAIGS
jgi:hypothetical protein